MRFYRMSKIVFLQLIFFSLLTAKIDRLEAKAASSLPSLLPEVMKWELLEAPEMYLPENLFEYINGAAEIYIVYEFKELIVGQFKKQDAAPSLTVEIYDMGRVKNAFGIYSAERFPDSHFLSIGNGGYVEEGALNFIVDRYYIKLLCFDCEDDSEKILKKFAQEILKKVNDPKGLPSLLSAFPQEGLLKYSKKFVLRNFLGYSFLHDGYVASFKVGELEFECFIIEGEDVADAQRMLNQYLEKKKETEVYEIPSGYRLKDRYYHHIYLARVENLLCGVMKIKDGYEEIGEKYLKSLENSLKKTSKK
ncbi:MAG: hypothetical protein GTO17_12395 [Candidatus Aminicenantes bacterium]|nr:hypothetical protein [Candidatus Aminicenantes bacterium]